MPVFAEEDRFEVGLILFHKGDCSHALAEFGASEKAGEKKSVRSFYQGVCLARSGDLSAGSARLLAYVSTDGADPRGWQWLSRVQLLQKDFANARGSAQRAVELDPNSSEAYRTLGEIELELHNNNAAYQAWVVANRLNPRDTRTTYYLGRLFFEADFLNEATLWLQDTLRLMPTHSGALTYLGLCAEHLGNIEGAARFYLQAIYQSKLQNAPFSWAYVSYAKLLRQLDKDNEAIAILEECDKLCPEAHALALLGQVLAAQHQTTRAESALRRAIQQDRDLSVAHYTLSLVLRTTGRIEEAQAEMKRFRETKHAEEQTKNTISVIQR